ncbi:hypothetical protein GQR58_025969 [Nymphon striatum]|nr:hypothetical protein GQR58_025969 [Nymphon striatum]
MLRVDWPGVCLEVIMSEGNNGMILSRSLVTKTSLSLLTSLIIITPAFAGTNGQLTYGPLSPTSVPTLSGTMLIIMSLLLFVVAYKVSKQKGAHAGKFFVTLISASALVTGIGGVKFVSNVDAADTNPPLVVAEGETVEIFASLFNSFRNSTNVTQQIKAIELVGVKCGNFPNGEFVTNECRVGLTLAASESCNIDCSFPEDDEEGVACMSDSDCASDQFCSTEGMNSGTCQLIPE